MIRKPLVLLLFLYTTISFSQSLRINEVVSSNDSLNTDEFGEFDDWIELVNTGTDTINLAGLFITDQSTNLTRHQFSSSDSLLTRLLPNEIKLIWMDGQPEQGPLHISFKLSSAGEDIWLIDSNGTTGLEHVLVPILDSDNSYGWNIQFNSIGYFAVPTPGEPNSSVLFTCRSDAPQLSMLGGFYSAPIEINVERGASTRYFYTLDGTTPDSIGSELPLNITIDETQVVSVRAFGEGCLASSVQRAIYFFDHCKALPVISITTDPRNLYDQDYGILVDENIELRKDWKRPVEITYFNEQGEVQFEASADIRLFGASAIFIPQKSLSVFLNDPKVIETTVFGDFGSKKMESFLLRSSSDDWGATMLTDGFQQNVFRGRLNIDLQRYRPVSLYLNTEYMGIFNMRDKYNESYIKSNYGLSSEQFEIVGVNNFNKPPALQNHGSIDGYLELYYMVKDNDMSVDSNYQKVSQLMDVDNYIDYAIAEIYIGNRSWKHNRKVWREIPNGKFQWWIYDLDRGFLEVDRNLFLEFNKDDFIFRGLIANETFRNKFIHRMCVHMNTTFEKTRTVSILDSLVGVISEAMPKHIDRWSGFGGIQSVVAWEGKLDELRDFADGRQAVVYQQMIDFFDLQLPRDVQFLVNPADAGDIHLDGVILNSYPSTIALFTGLPIKVEAFQKVGYSWSDWRFTGDVIVSSEEVRDEVNMSSISTIQASFSQAPLYNKLFINEVLSSNTNDTIDEFNEFDDWIELYNASDLDVDLTSYYLSDDLQDLTKWQIGNGITSNTIIASRSYYLSWADGSPLQGKDHANFKVNVNGETIYLSTVEQSDTIIIDKVIVPKLATDVSFGREIDGAITFKSFTETTPLSSNGSVLSSVYGHEKIELKISPNPIRDKLHAEWGFGACEDVLFSVVGVNGRVISSGKINFNNEVGEMDLGLLPSGLYFLTLHNNKFTAVSKFVKD